MEQDLSKDEPKEKPALGLGCKVCGAPLYSTDHNNWETTYHCSSPEARFWDFDRGTLAQLKAKDHWDQSRREVFAKQA